jgi:heme/copper-type cytochrome/quinol oxidase subunit 2
MNISTYPDTDVVAALDVGGTDVTRLVVVAAAVVVVLALVALVVWALRRRDPSDETELFARQRSLTATWTSGPVIVVPGRLHVSTPDVEETQSPTE